MRPIALSFILAFLFLSYSIQGQEWRLYSSSDAVTDFKVYQDHIWISSGSGLTKVNMSTLEETTWNVINSQIPDIHYDQMAIDSSGMIWIGAYNYDVTTLRRFDGQTFETFTEFAGEPINTLLDIEVTPDGKMWLLANTIPNTLYLYDQTQFIPIALPSADLTYHRNSNANICAGANNHVWAVIADKITEEHFVGEYDGSAWTLHDVSTFGIKPEAEDSWTLDPDGNVYLFCRDQFSPKLLKYDGQGWSSIPLHVSAVNAEFIDEPLSIDQQGHIRILLWNNSLLHFDGNQWNEIQLSTMGFAYGRHQKMFIDGAGKWWIVHDEDNGYFELSKLYRFNGNATELIDLSNSALPTNESYTIYIDELNNKWLQSNMGLLKYNGQEWNVISLSLELSLYETLGSDHAGGIWLESYNDNKFVLFDGVAPSAFPIVKPNGAPVQFVLDYAVDHKGRIAASPHESNIMIFDKGQITYLDQIYYSGLPGIPDYADNIAFGPDGVLYALGYDLHRYEPDSTWTTFPLWEQYAHSYGFKIAPDSVVWVSEPIQFTEYRRMHLYDGTNWFVFDSPLSIKSLPEWDANGNPWFITNMGLCKYANGSWTCYDRSNSPIVPQRVIDFTIDDYNNVWIVLNYGGILVFNEDAIQDVIAEELPAVTGQVYRDMNQNGQFDNGDLPLALHRELMLPEGITTFSKFDGSYRIHATNGDHEVKYVPSPNWHIDNTPASYNIHVQDEPITNLDFALAPDQEKVDLNIFFAEGFPRCNSLSRYHLSYTNRGTLTENVQVQLVLDPNVQIHQITPEPDIISGDTLTWFASGVLPFATSQIRLDLQMPGVEQSTVTFQGYIDRFVNDTYERVDSIIVTQEILCSFDPNDKMSRTAHGKYSEQFLFDDPIHYTIRFQNTGNDTAFQVVIRDTLDINLDLATLEILAASHPYEAFLKPDRTLEFRFPNILLTDSTKNEIESHGFVSYSIKAKKDLPSPTIIQNTAHIYFDYNGSIQTNTEINELVEFLTGTYDEVSFKSLIQAYPNPTKNELLIKSVSSAHDEIEYQLTGMTGSPILSGTIIPGEVRTLSIASLPVGMYILHAESGKIKGAAIVVKGE